MSNSITVGDADALIALVLENDPHYQKAIKINAYLSNKKTTVVFPVTVFPEVITTLRRAFNQPQKAELINNLLQKGAFQVEYIDEKILLRASEIFAKANSKQNTFFDAIVAATAEKLRAESIFSFDNWYPKLGFKLAGL